MNMLPVLGGAAMGASALYMLRQALGDYRNALPSRHWPPVAGTLDETHLWGKRNVNGEMKDAEKLSVTYQYQVQGVSHTARAVAFYTLHYPETVEFAEHHPQGSQVTVYYHPGDPATSVLLPGPRENKPHAELVIGVLGLVAGLTVAILGWMGIVG